MTITTTTQCDFRLPIRVYIEDTDAGGVVFYANYLKYFERARTEFIRSLGVEFRESIKQNVSFVVSELEVKYIKSARLDDMVFATAKVTKLGKANIQFHQMLVNEVNEVLATAFIKVVCVELSTHKPRKMFPGLYQALKDSYS